MIVTHRNTFAWTQNAVIPRTPIDMNKVAGRCLELKDMDPQRQAALKAYYSNKYAGTIGRSAIARPIGRAFRDYLKGDK